MAIKVNSKPAEFCPEDCPFMDLNVSTSTCFADDKKCLTINTIECRHEGPCKMWHEKALLALDDGHKSCKGCIYMCDLYGFRPCTSPTPCIRDENGNLSGYNSTK